MCVFKWWWLLMNGNQTSLNILSLKFEPGTFWTIFFSFSLTQKSTTHSSHHHCKLLQNSSVLVYSESKEAWWYTTWCWVLCVCFLNGFPPVNIKNVPPAVYNHMDAVIVWCDEILILPVHRECDKVMLFALNYIITWLPSSAWLSLVRKDAVSFWGKFTGVGRAHRHCGFFL